MPTRTKSSRARIATLAEALVLLWSALAAAPAMGADAGEFGPDSHKHFIERVNQAQTTDYRAVLGFYEAHRLSAPDDIVSQIERCRFIETFAYSEDATIESASDDLESCRAELESSPHKDDVEVILYGVEFSSYDDDGFNTGKALIPASKAWPELQRSRLLELLAQRARMRDEAAAGDYAIGAVYLNPGSTALPQALERWKQLGAKRKVRQAIIAAPETLWETVPRTQAAQVLLDIGEAEMAVRFLQEKRGKNDYGAGLMLARALAANGEYGEAAKQYREEFEKTKYAAMDSRLEFFEFELAHGTEKDALAAYDAMRTAEPNIDVLGRYRVSLVAAYPHLLWDRKTWRALLAMLVMALVVCLLPLVVIIPIHYRGLARRLQGPVPESLEGGWRLRHAWYAAAVFLLAGSAAVYILAPATLTALLPWTSYVSLTQPSDVQLAKVGLWSTIATVVLLLPLLRGQPIKKLLLGRWSIKRSVFVGLGLAILFKILVAVVGRGLKSAGALGSDTVRMIQGADEAYGLLGMLLLIGVLVPVVEEFVFRGVLLKAFRGQVSFLFATLVQATAFTLLHEEREMLVFLFAFALMLGWLVKRSEGLLAPIVMHCVNNVTAGLAIVGITAALNR
jgi:membrane protease YdiL (CAAX protease family)